MSKYVYANGAIHNDHHKEWTLNISGKTDVVALMRAMMRENVEDVVEVEEETKNSIIDNTVQEQLEEVNTHKSGRKKESLFKGKNGQKDEELTKSKANEFLQYLEEQGLNDVMIDTTKKNGVNKAFVLFYTKWKVNNGVPKIPNGSACYRFLKDDCHLPISLDIKTYGEFIRKMILET